MAAEPPKPRCDNEADAREFAEVWWSDYKQTPIEASEYTTKEGLFDQLRSQGDFGMPPVRLVKLSWLLERARQVRRAKSDEERRGLALPRRQELERQEPGAFFPPEEAESLVEHAFIRSKMDYAHPLRIVSVSYGWLTPEHPDPLGEQLLNVEKKVLELRHGRLGSFLHRAGEALGLTGCLGGCIPRHKRGGRSRLLPAEEFGVFWDWMSLPQKDGQGNRTPEEKACFQAALQRMGTWYGHVNTTTIILSTLPPDWPKRTQDAPYFPPGWLKGKGWPTFEAASSEMVKPILKYSWPRISSMSSARPRGPPLHPKAFAAKLAQRMFTNGADLSIVAKLYADTLQGTFGAALECDYAGGDWSDDDMRALAESLPLARKVQDIDLSVKPRVTKEGYDALALAITQGAAESLEAIYVDKRAKAAASGLAAACSARGIDARYMV